MNDSKRRSVCQKVRVSPCGREGQAGTDHESAVSGGKESLTELYRFPDSVAIRVRKRA